MHSTSDVINRPPITTFVENAGLLYGLKEGKTWTCHLKYISKGSAIRVEFDWEVVFEHETMFGNVLGFYHTHPFGLIKPSQRDIRTMRVWCDCLGKRLLCIIGIPGLTHCETYAYLFINHRSFGRKARVVEHEYEKFIIKV